MYRKLIITDLDNTLLRSDKSISEYTVSVLQKCRERGYGIAFATARSEPAMERFIEKINPDVIISNGGAVIRANGNIIYQNTMSEEDVSRIIQMCYRFTESKGLITLDCDKGYFCNFVPNDPDRYNGYKYCDFEIFKNPAYKITAELEREEWGAEIIQTCPDCTVISFTGENWRRFAAKGSDKETALRMVTSYMKIDLCDVVAFGDDTNDLGMLKLAGTSVAVANAINEVKAVANYIADSNNDDGVAKFIEKFIL